MKTHEVEDMLGITKQALIYYEKEGLILPQRLNNRYRDYTQKDIDILKLILLLRSMEISIDEIKLILNEAKKLDKNKLILLALGPTATVLAYDLSKLGYQAIDIGHIDIEYEWFLQGAKEKVAIENKYVGEAKGGRDIKSIDNKEYLQQIKVKIL